jgi:hypothetical protein
MNQQQSMKACLAAIIVILAIASVLVCAHTYRGGQYSNSDMTQAPPGQTKTELYQEMLITALRSRWNPMSDPTTKLALITLP